MLSTIRIKNFQSLKDISLELGKLTVIVGPSSSGKTALMRAIKVLASNSRGAPYVTHGEKIATVQANGQDWAAVIERGEAHGVYKLLAHGKDHTFTKLQGSVPSEITSVLGIEPVGSDGLSLCFAGQFDRPYLLDDSGAQVARTLGELTNVNIIFEASREANRRRLAANTALKTRQTDLQDLLAQAQQYKGLQERIKQLETAESLLDKIADLEPKVQRLRSLIEDIEVYERSIARLSARSDVQLPDYSLIEIAQNRLADLKQVLYEVNTQSRNENAAAANVEIAVASEHEYTEKLHDVLHEAGTCPTCGQSTKELVLNA